NWNVPTLDVDLSNTLTNTRRADAVKVPLNFSTIASLTVAMDDVGTAIGRICCPDETDALPSTTAAPLANFRMQVAGTVVFMRMHIRTSTTGTIAARLVSGTADSYRVMTDGFTWARRN